MSEKVLASVIVPIYNVEEYLRECVDSILSQTYTNLQIILVDDGSPDHCGAICDEYKAKDARIEVIHKPNGGLVHTRSYALERAGGDYYVFLDSDDYILPNALAWYERHIYPIILLSPIVAQIRQREMPLQAPAKDWYICAVSVSIFFVLFPC